MAEKDRARDQRSRAAQLFAHATRRARMTRAEKELDSVEQPWRRTSRHGLASWERDLLGAPEPGSATVADIEDIIDMHVTDDDHVGAAARRVSRALDEGRVRLIAKDAGDLSSETAGQDYESAWDALRGSTQKHRQGRAALARLAERAGVDTRRRPYQAPNYDRPDDLEDPNYDAGAVIT